MLHVERNRIVRADDSDLERVLGWGDLADELTPRRRGETRGAYTGRAAAVPAPVSVQQPWQSGRYYFVPPLATVSTDATLGNGTVRAVAAYVPNPVTLARIGAEITAAGDVGSKLRLGIYSDDGTGRPGTLLLDAGTIAGDVVAVQEITISLPVGAGLVWIAGVVQLVTVTQPTVRVNSVSGPLPSDVGTVIPSAGLTSAGWTVSGVTGALPATFGAPSTQGKSPRMFVKVA